MTAIQSNYTANIATELSTQLNHINVIALPTPLITLHFMTIYDSEHTKKAKLHFLHSNSNNNNNNNSNNNSNSNNNNNK